MSWQHYFKNDRLSSEQKKMLISYIKKNRQDEPILLETKLIANVTGVS
jgi:hypothetical protein